MRQQNYAAQDFKMCRCVTKVFQNIVRLTCNALSQILVPLLLTRERGGLKLREYAP